MIDCVRTSPSLRRALLVVMATMHFHIAQTGLFIVFFAFRGPKETIRHQFKMSLWCKIGRIRSWGSWFEAEISLFMMFVYVFNLFIRLSLILLNMQMK